MLFKHAPPSALSLWMCNDTPCFCPDCCNAQGLHGNWPNRTCCTTSWPCSYLIQTGHRGSWPVGDMYIIYNFYIEFHWHEWANKPPKIHTGLEYAGWGSKVVSSSD